MLSNSLHTFAFYIKVIGCYIQSARRSQHSSIAAPLALVTTAFSPQKKQQSSWNSVIVEKLTVCN